MPNRQEIRSEETKRAILTAAKKLFSERGFDGVTMREIARASSCSHTTIYIYFKDKEALLHQLSMGPLQHLKQQLESALNDMSSPPVKRLKSITLEFIEFCLANRNMFDIFFMERATRVDEAAPGSEINQLRIQLFGLLRRAVKECLEISPTEDLDLAYARIYFFTLHGIIGTYKDSDEPLTELLERLRPTFELASEVLVNGFTQNSVRHDKGERT